MNREAIRKILQDAYGVTTMTNALCATLFDMIENGQPTEEEIRNTCWNWFAGGTTAESVAKRIVKELDNVRS